MTVEEIEHMIGHVEEGITVKEGQLRDLYIALAKLKADLARARHDSIHPHLVSTASD